MKNRGIAILLVTTFLWVAGSGLVRQPAQAQLDAGMSGWKPYDIQDDDWPHATLGHVVVVAAESAAPPEGFDAGTESWHWNGTAWPDGFRLVPASWSEPPSVTWVVFDHEVFDLSATVPFPAISVGANDRYYEVEKRSATKSKLMAHFWFHDGVQTAYGLDSLTTTTLRIGAGQALYFAEISAPGAGDIDVYETELP